MPPLSSSLLTRRLDTSPSLLSSSPVREVPASREASHPMGNGEEEVRDFWLSAGEKDLSGLLLSGQEELMGVVSKQLYPLPTFFSH